MMQPTPKVNPYPLPAFAVRLSSLRIAKGMTQADLADATGLEPSAISHFECGRREPSLANLAKLVRALGCDPSHLIGTDDADNRTPTAGEIVAAKFSRDKVHLSDEEQRRLAVLIDDVAQPMIDALNALTTSFAENARSSDGAVFSFPENVDAMKMARAAIAKAAHPVA